MKDSLGGPRASTPQLMRRLNAQRVLDHMWTSAPSTAAELMEATGLTRATVLALCRELTEQGWLQPVEDARQAGAYTKGRPALRYAFRSDAGFVIGVDAGQHRISASAADLRGRELAQVQRSVEFRLEDAQARRREILAAVDSVVGAAEIDNSHVQAVVLGVPAPVDSAGRSPTGLNEFWGQMNPDLVSLCQERSWDCTVENDANLAALAELHLDPGSRESSFAALLTGERFGAGIVLMGELLRQPRGGAGEMGMLELVSGVESTLGLGAWARLHAQEMLRSGEASAESWGVASTEDAQAEHVFAAARRQDAAALAVVERLADRLARICVVLAGLLDLDRIVLSGAMAPALTEIVDQARGKVQESLYAPWLEMEVSQLGAEAVRAGAVRFGVEEVRRSALRGEADLD